MFDGLSIFQIFRFIILSVMFFFIVGSLFGWTFECFFRRFFTAKKWVNPGFLIGPYLPLYGLGAVILFGLGLLKFVNPFPVDTIGYTVLWNFVIVFLIVAAAVVLELIAGLIFIRWLRIPLWNYNESKNNYKGIICPKFIVLWASICILFYFLLYTPLLQAAIWCQSREFMIFLFGLFYGIFTADLIYSVITKIIKPKKLKVIGG